ncbi:MAG: redox-sensing transcriptional repressor Rex [candidate division WOR-3 bacterium]
MKKIPELTIRRLSHYLRCMERLKEEGENFVQSKDLAKFCKISDSLVRRDLSYFGEFGVKGKGYSIEHLTSSIKQILGLEKTRKVIIAGVGKIGSALINYPFHKFNFQIVAGFDIKPDLIGNRLNNIPIYHINDLERVVEAENVHIGIIAVPEDAANFVVEKMIGSGIKGILSFVLVRGPFPPDVFVRYIELPSELEVLSYLIEKGGAS